MTSTYLSPLAGRGRIASAMRSIVRCNPGEGRHRTHLCSEFAEAGPSPQPSPREERGEGEVIDRHRLKLNPSCSDDRFSPRLERHKGKRGRENVRAGGDQKHAPPLPGGLLNVNWRAAPDEQPGLAASFFWRGLPVDVVVAAGGRPDRKASDWPMKSARSKSGC
jgi:hypothetical protein